MKNVLLSKSLTSCGLHTPPASNDPGAPCGGGGVAPCIQWGDTTSYIYVDECMDECVAWRKETQTPTKHHVPPSGLPPACAIETRFQTPPARWLTAQSQGLVTSTASACPLVQPPQSVLTLAVCSQHDSLFTLPFFLIFSFYRNTAHTHRRPDNPPLVPLPLPPFHQQRAGVVVALYARPVPPVLAHRQPGTQAQSLCSALAIAQVGKRGVFHLQRFVARAGVEHPVDAHPAADVVVGENLCKC